MANMFDRDATDDLDDRAGALSPPSVQRAPAREPEPSPVDRARGRGYQPPDDTLDRARQGTGPPAPSEAITTTPPGAPPAPRAQVTDGDPTGQREATGVLYGQGRRPIPPGPGQQGETGGTPDPGPRPRYPEPPPPDGGRVAEQYTFPEEGPDAPLRTGGAAPPSEEGPDAPLRTAGVTPPGTPSEDEAGFRPGPLPKGKGGGGGGGTGGGRRKALGDQTRTEAYDPTLDRADPRNIGIIAEKGPKGEEGRVNPKVWEQAQKGAIDPTAPGVRTGEAAQKFTNHYTNALAGATEYMRDMFHQKKGDPNQAEGYAALTFKKTGAPDPKIVNDVFKVVDPNNELQPKERMELATRAMHDWYLSKGDKKSADKVAAEILQHGNTQASALGNQALQAFKQGDREGAKKAILAAYDWLPDGYSADIKGNNLVVMGPDNKPLNNIPLDDKMIQNLGTGLATGTLFWDLVQNRAGVKDKFGPPQSQPGAAVDTSVPGPDGVARAPAAPGPAAPPGAAPVTPPGNQPAAPTPATPGPAINTQAPTTPAAPASPPAAPAPTAPATPPAAPPAEKTEQKSALATQVPPTLTPAAPATPKPAPTKPVEPTTTKKPIIYDAEGKEVTSETKPAEQKIDEGKTTGQTKEGDKPVETKVVDEKTGEVKTSEAKPGEDKDPRVWSDDDPDSVPINKNTKKPHVVRRETYPMSDDVKIAVNNKKIIEKNYQDEQRHIIEDMKTPGLNLKDREVAGALDRRKKLIEDQYKADLKEQDEIIKDWKKESAEHDRQEKKASEYHPLKGTDKDAAVEKIDKRLQERLTMGEKNWPEYKANPLRLYNTKEKWTDIREAVLAAKALNPKISEEKLTDYVLSMMTHVEKGDVAKSQSANKHEGAKGSRFVVLGEDLARNPVIGMGVGNANIRLHLPADTLNDIKRLKAESYEAKDKPVREAAAKTAAEKAAAEAALKEPKKPNPYVPGQAAETFRLLGETQQAERERIEQEKGKPLAEQMQKDPDTAEGLTGQQKLEADRKRRRQAADKARQQAEP